MRTGFREGNRFHPRALILILFLTIILKSPAKILEPRIGADYTDYADFHGQRETRGGGREAAKNRILFLGLS
jgi:hypothetical protein